MMSGSLLFVGEGFFPYARLPSFASLGGWRALLGSSTVPFSSLARLARGPVAPPLFGVSIHRTPSSTREPYGAVRPSERLRPKAAALPSPAAPWPTQEILAALRARPGPEARSPGCAASGRR